MRWFRNVKCLNENMVVLCHFIACLHKAVYITICSADKQSTTGGDIYESEWAVKYEYCSVASGWQKSKRKSRS